MEDLENIIESLLFVAEAPLSLDQLKATLPEAEPCEIQNAILSLKQAYEAKTGGFYIHEVAGGYQFRTRPVYKEWIRRLLQPKPPKLSTPAMETLAIVAYRQPVLRTEIEQIRGVNSGNSIRLLMERNLIRVLGRREIPGRPLVYATTLKFLETFDLKDLKDLPSLKEIDELQSRLAKPQQQEIVFGDDEPMADKHAADDIDIGDDSEERISHDNSGDEDEAGEGEDDGGTDN